MQGMNRRPTGQMVQASATQQSAASSQHKQGLNAHMEDDCCIWTMHSSRTSTAHKAMATRPAWRLHTYIFTCLWFQHTAAWLTVWPTRLDLRQLQAWQMQRGIVHVTCSPGMPRWLAGTGCCMVFVQEGNFGW